jgi:hypothetical protein
MQHTHHTTHAHPVFHSFILLLLFPPFAFQRKGKQTRRNAIHFSLLLLLLLLLVAAGA